MPVSSGSPVFETSCLLLRRCAEALADALKETAADRDQRRSARDLLKQAFILEEHLSGGSDDDADVLAICRQLDTAAIKLQQSDLWELAGYLQRRYRPRSVATVCIGSLERGLLCLPGAEQVVAPFEARLRWLMARVEAAHGPQVPPVSEESETAEADVREDFELVRRPPRRR